MALHQTVIASEFGTCIVNAAWATSPGCFESEIRVVHLCSARFGKSVNTVIFMAVGRQLYDESK